MGLLIEKVRVKNFRSLKDVEITLSPLTLLVGSNNSGKTSFLKALNLALGIERKNVTLDDLFIDGQGNRITGEEGRKIIIDVKIIPTNEVFERQENFDDESWAAEFAGNTTFESIEGNNIYETLMFRTQFTFTQNSESYKVEKFIIRDNWDNPNIDENAEILISSKKHYKWLE